MPAKMQAMPIKRLSRETRIAHWLMQLEPFNGDGFQGFWPERSLKNQKRKS
jgi:hypothetical protein